MTSAFWFDIFMHSEERVEFYLNKMTHLSSKNILILVQRHEISSYNMSKLKLKSREPVIPFFFFLQYAFKYYSLVFDAVYTPKITRLLKEAEESGATIVTGLEMFMGQAYGQYENFTGLPGKLNVKV